MCRNNSKPDLRFYRGPVPQFDTMAACTTPVLPVLLTLLQRYLADLTDLDLNQRNSADANQDERVDVQDVTLLQRILAGAI